MAKIVYLYNSNEISAPRAHELLNAATRDVSRLYCHVSKTIRKAHTAIQVSEELTPEVVDPLLDGTVLLEDMEIHKVSQCDDLKE